MSTAHMPDDAEVAPVPTEDAVLARLSLADDAVRSDDETLAALVYTKIREAIHYGELPPNTVLPQVRLATIMGVSRTPIRDALLRLSQEGLVRSVKWRGFVVNDFSPEEVLHVYEVRIALETAAIERAVGQHTPRRVAELQEIHLAIAEHPDLSVEDYYEYNRRFHTLLLEPCGNPVLMRMLEQIWQMPETMRLFRAYLADRGGFPQMVAEHQEMLEAAREGKHGRLVAAVTEPLEAGRLLAARWVNEAARRIGGGAGRSGASSGPPHL
jgi:DNA-binding GntR family transcriptional regulator